MSVGERRAEARKRRQEQCQKSCACVVISSLVATIVIQCLAKPVEVTVPNTPEVPAAQPYLAACSAHAKCAQQGQDDCCPSSDGVLMGCCSPIPSSVKVDPFRGMCYAPTPAKNVSVLPTDDYMAPWAEALWGKSGRDDLSAIRQMGFKVLRVYGNDPRLSHEAFLSRCTALGLKVIVAPWAEDAESEFPETTCEDPQSKCATAPPYDCFTEVRLQFTTMLKNGFTVRDGEGQMRYHPAIEAIILINEPELKITYQGAIAKDAWSKGYYTKALLSALDGALRAEESLSIMGAKPPFTVVNSFSTCETCKTNVAGRGGRRSSPRRPSDVRVTPGFLEGALKPDFFGYDPRHDLKSALQNRWLLGFNTQDTSDVICKQVLQPLKATPLSGLPIWAGEYKAWYQSMPDSKVADFKEDWSKLSSWVQQGASCDAAGAPLRGP
ncbi:unnamed protein product [Durusdinium trenchii]|uniref:Uncharacterized protein n=1 Tax=Durusdinium trenchii TaxID=1381693 RepID=A0ABP0MM71_9DINO